MKEMRENRKMNRVSCDGTWRSLAVRFSCLLAVLVLLGGLPMASSEGTFAAGGETLGRMDLFDMGESMNLTSTIEGDIQRVFSAMNGSAYEPITVYESIPVEWTLIAPEGSVNFCNETIMIPEYNLIVELQEGENLIHFTPEQSGTILFGCWMGMIRSSITVLDESGADAAGQTFAANLAFNPDEGVRDVMPCDTCCQ